jgi:hypothetical protein
MATIPDSVRAVIESGRLVHLGTLNRDGSPHVNCAWIGLAGDQVVRGYLGVWQKGAEGAARPAISQGIRSDVDGLGLDACVALRMALARRPPVN